MPSGSAILPGLPAGTSGGTRPSRLRRAIAHLPDAVWLAADLGTAALATVAGYLLSPFQELAIREAHPSHLHPAWHILAYSLFVVLFLRVLNVHSPSSRRERQPVMLRITAAVLLATIATVVFAQFLAFDSIGRYILFTAAALTVLALGSLRLAYWQVTEQHAPSICLIGSPDFCRKSLDLVALAPNPLQPFVLAAGSAVRQKTSPATGFAVRPSLRGASLVARHSASPYPELETWIRSQQFEQIVIQDSLPATLLSPLVDSLDHGQQVLSYTGFVERYFHRVPVDEVEQRWFLAAPLEGVHPFYRALKRLSDIAIASLGICLAAPLILLAAVAIRLSGPGPVFYSQTRVGYRNVPFRIYKLRSMRIDAEQGGARWAAQGDRRVTMVGKILRKTRIDELPQFWNILKGDMAFIGPRPERPEFTGQLASGIPFYLKRHLVRPGLTGWAQINYPYGASLEDAKMKLTYDLYYVKHASLELDLHILIRTLGAVMQGAR